MLRNAPHLVHDLSFVVPAYNYSSLPYYGIGLKVYERLSGKLSLGRSELLSRKQRSKNFPASWATTFAAAFSITMVSLTMRATLSRCCAPSRISAAPPSTTLKSSASLSSRQSRWHRARDVEGGAVFDLQAKAVINATGVHAEDTLALDGRPHGSLLAISQGSHFVLPRTFLPGKTALMIPKTSDGRVLFAIPWHGALIVGTTDVPVATNSPEPRALPEEKQFLSENIARYFGRAPRPEEILSVWSGLRPLVRKGGVKTSKLSRDHTILVSPSGLITVTGGKWTTYRRMGQDTVDRAAQVAALPQTPVRNARTEAPRLDRGSRNREPRMGVRIWVRSARASALSEQDPVLELASSSSPVQTARSRMGCTL